MSADDEPLRTVLAETRIELHRTKSNHMMINDCYTALIDALGFEHFAILGDTDFGVLHRNAISRIKDLIEHERQNTQ